MLNDAFYNLTLQLVEENKAIARIRAYYLGDAEGNETEQAFWQSLLEDKERHVEDLTTLLAAHFAQQ